MDICKRLNSVHSLNDYIELTQYLENKHNNVEIVLNMSTIICLKKIRCLEIEYFNKCDGTGAAFKLFERMLSSPPLRTWGLLGSELIGLIQYWLDAVRKHLISHHMHWWAFLKHLLGFIKEIRKKDGSLSSILVEETAECMLDLATHGKPEVAQRYEILHTFNLFCAESSREVRQALRPKLDHYFIRLSTILAGCGDYSIQQWSLECLLRWLQPRSCAVTRRAAADKWLRPHLYPHQAVEVFLQRNWINFFQDAQDFLNSCNEFNKKVTSVICRKLTVGNVVIISGKEKRVFWLHINTGSASMSVILDPQLLESLGVQREAACETLVIPRDTAQLVKLHRESSAVTVSVMTSEPPVVAPSAVRVFAEQPCDVTVVIVPLGNVDRVDNALRTVFQDKYQVLLDVENTANVSPSRPCSGRRNSMDEGSRFSDPVKEKPRRQGYMTKSRRPPSSTRSPSTASTTSLAQLHDKLSALPYYEFTKEPVSVVAHPELSVVIEQNESEICNSFDSTSTLKLRRCGERSFRAYIEQKMSQSDGEAVKYRDLETIDENNEQILENRKNAKGSQSDNEYAKKRAKATQKEGAISSLFAATIGSADESVLNATIERLPRDKPINTDNLIELLVQEALQVKSGDKDRESDSGINTGDGKKTQEHKTQDSETIEDTQYTELKNIQPKKNTLSKTPKNTIVSKSTSDESNTEAINETPVNYVNARKRNQRRSVRKTETEKGEKNYAVTHMSQHNVKEVEDFFHLHFAENQMSDLIISPTLAKKINATSSESSEDFLQAKIDEDFNIRDEVLPGYDIVECQNDIVTKVCIDFDKCTEYLAKDNTENETLDMAKNISASPKGHKQLQDTNVSNDELKDKKNIKPAKATRSKSKKVIKLKFPGKKQKAQNPKAKSKLKLEPVSKMSTIIEDNNESDANKTSSSDAKKNSTDNNKETPIIRRRRKLYSPKDDEAMFDKPASEEVASNKPVETVQSDEDDIALADIQKEKAVTPKSVTTVTPKSAATSYKDIEKDRQRYKRLRRRKTKNAESPPSPKTARLNQVFEKLKENVESNENIILVDKKVDKDIGIFNFTSDSEDEDFKQKKIEIQKRTSTTTIGSGTSVMSTRRGRAITKVNYTENGKEPSNETTKPATKRKRATKRRNTKAKSCEVNVDLGTELVDERMREVEPEVLLNTSFVVEKADENVKNPEPIIKVPELEAIEDENAMDNLDCEDGKKQAANIEVEDKKRKPKRTEKHHTKRQEMKKTPESTKDDDSTVSPLPGLIIETEKGKNDGEDSLTANFVQKVQKMYKEGPGDDTITTQNMLSDNERGNYSPQMNITEELGRIIEDDLDKCNKKTESRVSDIVEKISDVIDDTMNSEEMEKSKIETKKPKRNRLRLKAKDKTDSSLTSNSVKDAKIETKVIKFEPENPDKKDSNKSKATATKSNIQEIVCEDIISTEKQIITRSKSSKSLSRSKEMEVIELTEEEEVPSEKSIATDGITAHGDFNEPPPSPKLLNEKLSPRELEDMDQNIKDYYVALNREVNTSNDTNESKSNERIEKGKKAENKPSKRVMQDINSPSSSEQKSEKIRRNMFDCDVTKWLPSLRDTDSETCESSRKVRSPTVSLARLAREDIAKWLPSAKSTSESTSEEIKEISSRKVRSPTVSLARLTREDIAKWLPSAKSTPESTSEKIKEIRRSPRLARKSQISPIQLEDFMIETKSKKHDTSESKYDTLNSRSVEAPKRSSNPHKFMLRPTYESSPISKTSKSENSPPKIVSKRTSPVARTTDIKRRKLDLDFRVEKVNISGSTQSSNVDEWLRRMSATYKADNMDVSREAVQNLMEKLDTTLVEIHQNTAKDLIGLFVNAQKELTELKEERRRTYRETAVGILTTLAQLVDAKFGEMDQRAEKRESRFMSWLQERAGEVLRRDCRQKRAMVAILREDVQAVADYIARMGMEEG